MQLLVQKRGDFQTTSLTQFELEMPQNDGIFFAKQKGYQALPFPSRLSTRRVGLTPRARARARAVCLLDERSEERRHTY